MKVVDMTEQRFGRLVVVERAGSAGKGATWLCRCDCGTESIVRRTNLIMGHVTSCGCFSRESSSLRQRARKRPKATCRMPGCDRLRETHRSDYCGTHMQRVRRYGNPDAVTSEDVRRDRSRDAQLARVTSVKPTSYRKLFGRHEHRRVMESALGRALGRDEVVHHIDGNRHNNELGNLRVMSRIDHIRLHQSQGDL